MPPKTRSQKPDPREDRRLAREEEKERLERLERAQRRPKTPAEEKAFADMITPRRPKTQAEEKAFAFNDRKSIAREQESNRRALSESKIRRPPIGGPRISSPAPPLAIDLAKKAYTAPQRTRTRTRTDDDDFYGVITPQEDRGSFYNQRGRRMDGSIVQSQEDDEIKVARELYITPEEKDEIERHNMLGDEIVSDFSDDEYPEDFDRGRRAPPPPRPYQGNNAIQGAGQILRMRNDNVAQPRAGRERGVEVDNIVVNALDDEEFIGVNARGLGGRDIEVMERVRHRNYEEDNNKVAVIAREVEVLSGGNNDSLMNANDINREEKDPNAGNNREEKVGEERYDASGLQRGRNAHAVVEIDAENVSESMSRFNEAHGSSRRISDNDASIGRGFGINDGRMRAHPDDVIKVADSIMSSLDGLMKQRDQDGSWGSFDKKLEQNRDLNERMGMMNKVAMNKSMRDTVIKYRQPNRSFRNNAKDLLRNGSKTFSLIENEFEP